MSTKIEWCDETINPLGWGCYGPYGTPDNPKPCPYCYAKRIARRKLLKCPQCQQFIPHWHPEALEKPRRWKKPRRIFVQSMGDLFHDYTPKEHIEVVLQVVKKHPQHTFLFLTKNSDRLAAFDFPANAWAGVSFDGYSTRGVPLGCNAKVKFASIEPLLTYPEVLPIVDWYIVGAQTGPGARPVKKKWVQRVIDCAREDGKAIFLKDNLKWPEKIQEFPEVQQ